MVICSSGQSRSLISSKRAREEETSQIPDSPSHSTPESFMDGFEVRSDSTSNHWCGGHKRTHRVAGTRRSCTSPSSSDREIVLFVVLRDLLMRKVRRSLPRHRLPARISAKYFSAFRQNGDVDLALAISWRSIHRKSNTLLLQVHRSKK